VAIITNGTAILGLGAIGPVAGMPVMIRKGQVVLALSNPNAEIRPEGALAAGASGSVRN